MVFPDMMLPVLLVMKIPARLFPDIVLSEMVLPSLDEKITIPPVEAG